MLPFPRAVVAAYAGDPGNAPDWYANIDSVRWQTPPPVAVGSRMDFEARFLGRRLAYTYEVVEHVPGERLVMRTADGPFPMETTYTWSEDPAGTEMRLRNRGTPSGFAKVAARSSSFADGMEGGELTTPVSRMRCSASRAQRCTANPGPRLLFA